MSATMESARQTIKARGRLIGKQLDLRSLGQARRVAVQPLPLSTGDTRLAVLFRYGAVVLFDVPVEEETALLGSLSPLVSEGVTVIETEDLDIRIAPRYGGRIQRWNPADS